MHDVTVRSYANRSSEHARELERAAPRQVRERAHFDRFIQVGMDIISETIEHISTQCAARLPDGP